MLNKHGQLFLLNYSEVLLGITQPILGHLHISFSIFPKLMSLMQCTAVILSFFNFLKCKFHFFTIYLLNCSVACDQAPLCVEGWDEALHEIGKLSYETVLSPQNATSLLQAVEDLPVLVIVGAEDALVSIKSAQAMASKLVNSVSISLLSLVMLLVICLESWNQIKLNDSLGPTLL